MSRPSRQREIGLAAFQAEAAAAARYRRLAASARRRDRSRLAERWEELAARRDALAVRLLEAFEPVGSAAEGALAALAEERYEVEVLLPRLLEEWSNLAGAEEGDERGRVLEALLAEKEDLLDQLADLQRQVEVAAGRDLGDTGGEEGEEGAA